MGSTSAIENNINLARDRTIGGLDACVLDVLPIEFGGKVPLFRRYEKMVAGDDGRQEKNE